MKKTLADYLLLVEKEFEYRMKFAFNLEDGHYAKLERMLSKYDLVDVKSVYKSPFQKNPLDFPNLSVAEIFIIDIVTRMPIACGVFVQEASKALGIPEALMIMRSTADPYEDYNKEIVDRAESPDYVPKLEDPDYKTDTDNIDPSEHFGDEYNKEMVDTIKAEVGSIPSENEKKYDSLFKKALDQSKTANKSPLTDVHNPDPSENIDA